MKNICILSFWFFVCKTVFLLKMVHKDKNTKKKKKKKTQETMNFGSTKWYNILFWLVKNWHLICSENIMSTRKCFNIFTREMLCPQYFWWQIISSRLLQVVISGQKSNFVGKFKLESITIYYQWFVMKVLWKMLWT